MAESKIENLHDENERLRKQIEEVVQERNVARMEKRGFQNQCQSIIMKWDTISREKKDLEKDVSRIRVERDHIKNKLEHAVTESGKNLERLRGERNRAHHESRLIMSERDSVLKEIDQLQEKVDEMTKKFEASEKEKKVAKDDVETLRREIASALHDRDHALKQINDLKERHGDLDHQTGEQNSDLLSSQDLNFNRRDRLSMTDRDRQRLEEKIKRESMEIKDVVNKEHEALKKEMEKMQAELNGKNFCL